MKQILCLSLILIVAVLFSSAEESVYTVLERSLPAVLGACLGGMLACTSIVISVLSSSSKETKAKAKNSTSFEAFVRSLERDIKILIMCLFAVVTLPYLRLLDYPVSISFMSFESSYLKSKLFSSLEIFATIIAFLVIYELACVLISILRRMMSIHDTKIN